MSHKEIGGLFKGILVMDFDTSSSKGLKSMESIPLPVTSRHSQTVKGMVFLALSMFIFVNLNAGFKLLTQPYPPLQIVLIRNVFSLIPCGLLVLYHQNLSLFHKPAWKLHFFRSLASVISLMCLFESLFRLPLAEATLFMFMVSLFSVILAAFFLKEPLTGLKIFSVVIGLGGVLIVSGPGHMSFNGGALFGLISAFIESALLISNRRLGQSIHPLAIHLYYLLFSIVIAGIVLGIGSLFFPMALSWQAPPLQDGILFVVMGVGAGFAQYFLFSAYTLAPVGTLSPVLYTLLIWSLIYDIVFFHLSPTLSMIIGGTFILLANIFVLYDQSKKSQ